MTNAISNLVASTVDAFDYTDFTLVFVEDSEYEFVGGGNAVNSY